MNRYFEVLNKFDYENINSKCPKNSQNDCSLNLAWSASLNKLSSEDEQRTANISRLMFIDIRRCIKRRLGMINRALGYQNCLKIRAKLLLPAKQLKAEKIIQENIDKIKAYEKELFASKTTGDLSRLKRPKLTLVEIE